MPRGRYLTTDAPVTSFGPGRAGTAELRAAYLATPQNNGTYTPDICQDTFERLNLGPTINDGGHTFGVVNRDYQDAPNLADVPTGGGGLPSTPHSPNIARPTSADGSSPGMNAADIPVAATPPSRGGGAFGVGSGLTSPSVTSPRISRQRIGNLILGRSTPR